MDYIKSNVPFNEKKVNEITFLELKTHKYHFSATSYVAATGGALATALGLNSLVKHSPPLIGRFVPFCAVAAANCVNIPLMRQSELKNGKISVKSFQTKIMSKLNSTIN